MSPSLTSVVSNSSRHPGSSSRDNTCLLYQRLRGQGYPGTTFFFYVFLDYHHNRPWLLTRCSNDRCSTHHQDHYSIQQSVLNHPRICPSFLTTNAEDISLSPFPIVIAAIGLQLFSTVRAQTDFFDPNVNGGFMLDNGELNLLLG